MREALRGHLCDRVIPLTDTGAALPCLEPSIVRQAARHSSAGGTLIDSHWLRPLSGPSSPRAKCKYMERVGARGRPGYR